MSRTYVWIHCVVVSALARLERLRLDQRGQASAEYALVLLGAAAIALLVMAWATRTNRVGRLLDAVMDQLLDRGR